MSETPLDRLAKQASNDPFFLGFRLAEFAAVEQLDDAAFAAQLGCEQSVLTHLRLCRAPRTESPPAFREDVECIATKFGIPFAALAEVAKPVLVTVKRDGVTVDPPAAVLAARDRKETS